MKTVPLNSLYFKD